MINEKIFDGQLLQAQASGVFGGTLLVSFDYRRIDRSDGAFLPVKFNDRFTQQGIAQLRIQTGQNDWYANDETADLERALAAYAKHFDTVHMFGFSMGGYGAFRFAKTMRATKIFCLISIVWNLGRFASI